MSVLDGLLAQLAALQNNAARALARLRVEARIEAHTRVIVGRVETFEQPVSIHVDIT